MRRIFTSPRLENVERVAALLKEHGVEVVSGEAEIKGRAADGTISIACGETVYEAANLLICTIPLPVLAKIENDFAPAYKSAIQNAVYGDAVKVAFQSERFWEHKDQVYGGLSFTDRETSVVWYPSGNYGASQGIILGAYNWDNQASTFAKRSIAEQIEYARTSIDKMHPGNGGLLGRGMSVHWQKIPYNLGPWANFNEEPSPIYDLLSQPDGPFYFAGEHLSHVGAWQQGAFASAHRTVGMIDARVRAGRPVTETRAQ